MTQLVQPAMKAVIKYKNTFLILKQRIGEVDIWDLPGGKVEYGENPYSTLNREIKEETGLKVTIGKPLGVWWFFRKVDGTQIVCTTFLCTTESAQVDLHNNPAQEDVIDHQWVTKKEILGLAFGDNTHNLIEILKQI